MKMQVNSGPIPGENYTDDTKNYPWRQPPEYTDIDDALDYLSGRITQFKVANGLLTMAEMNVPLYKIASFVLLSGMGEGKWTPDFMLALSGPVTRMIELMCIGFDVKYTLGLEDDDDIFHTGTFFNNQNSLKLPQTMKLIDEQMPDIKSQAEQQSGGGEGQEQDLAQSGFMAMQGGNQDKSEKQDKGM